MAHGGGEAEASWKRTAQVDQASWRRAAKGKPKLPGSALYKVKPKFLENTL